MKEVKAIIQQFKLSSVTMALQEIPGFPGMTVSDCRGFGKEKALRIKTFEQGEEAL